MVNNIDRSSNPDPRENEDFFLCNPDKLNDPYGDWRYFRENNPVFYYPPLAQWYIFKYDDVVELFDDRRLSADRMKGFADAAPEEVRDDLREIVPFLEKWVLMQDGEAHDRIRDFLHIGFNAAIARGMKEQIQKSADALLDRVEKQGYMDGSRDYGFILTAHVLSDFLGVREEDRDRVIQWSVDFVDFFNVIPITVDTTTRLVKSAKGLIEYTRELIAERRVKSRGDFLSALIEARGGTFSDDEIVANAMLILLAGHLAVRNLIGNTIYLLLTHPEQLEKLKKNPELLNGAIQETLRYESPVTLIPRIALSDFEFRGHLIRKGDIVQLSIASANRDAGHFPDPDTFDITRKSERNIGFGHGVHTCLGAILAKQEAAIAIETLFRRMPGIKLDATKTIEWYRNAGNRGPESLPLVF